MCIDVCSKLVYVNIGCVCTSSVMKLLYRHMHEGHRWTGIEGHILKRQRGNGPKEGKERKTRARVVDGGIVAVSRERGSAPSRSGVALSWELSA